MIEELIKRILDKLSGADFWIAAGFLVVGVVCWLLIGKTKKQEKRLLRQQIVSAIVLLILAAGFIWLNHRFFIRELIFSKNVTGILVMRMVGDDALNSLQGDLVAKLNAELQKEAPGQQIEVRARAETLEESEGLTAAHERARAIGQRLNAKLVIWGRKIGDKKFYPRITVMAAPKDWSAARERTHEEQSITELHLPEEVVDEPFYLIHFAAGYVYYGQNDYKEALRHFKAALVRKGATRDELADLQFFTAFCHSELAAGQKNMTADLREAIELYENAGKVYEARSNLDHWASVQNNLGSAYCNLPDGDRVANLQ
jgi:tetratricopeptide (TPR) repeat protein